MGEITEQDKQLTRSTWGIIEKDPEGNGIALFKELFAAHPTYKNFFEKLKANESDDLFQSARFKRHLASSLFPSISKMLANLDNADELKAQLTDLGANHRKRGVKKEHFESLKVILVQVLKKNLGDIFTPETEAAWNKILTAAFNGIYPTLEKTEL